MVRGGNHGVNGVKIFGNENINVNDPLRDRFLWSQMIHYPNHQQNNASIFPYSYGSSHEFMWPNYTQESSFVVDGVLANEEALKWTNFNQTPTLGYGENTNIVGRKTKKETSEVLIKGQWTNEEDRLNSYLISGLIVYLLYSFFNHISIYFVTSKKNVHYIEKANFFNLEL